MKKNLFFLMAIAIMIMSCVKDVESFSPYQYSMVPINSKGEYAIVFGDYNARTKATVGSNSGNGYDSFALYAWNSNNDTIMNPYTVAYGANGYEYDNVGTQELKYFKNTANYYDFIGVIPTTHNMVLENGVAKVDTIKAFSVDDNRRNGVNNITADSPEEFLYAYANVTKSDYNNIVTLPFKHGNAVIYIGLSSDRNDTEILDYAPGVAEIPAIPEVNDTTDTWVNLKRGTNVDGSATKLKGPGESAYTDNVALPAELVNEIKSYYSINNGTPGDYDLHMGNSVWPSAEIRQLRIVKDIPAAYKITVEMYAGVTMDFFNGWKYLKDNGYDIQPRTSGGKPAVWDYVLIDAFVNGTAYTVVGLNYGNSQSAPQYTISEISPEVPYQAGVAAVPGVPATGSDGVYVNGVLCIPTKDTITTTPMAEYTGDKDTTLNYVKADVDTIYTNDVVFLGNSLVIPQPVPENITVVFDMCITNNTGDSVVFTDRKITRVINVNKDMKDLDYVASWNASNKYIYNFNFNGDSLTFSTSVTGWTVDSIHNFHVWDY